MIARVRKALDEKEKGFTLIELLIVIIILGILAAIAIPIFLNQRTRAVDAAARADVSTIAKQIATALVDNQTMPTVAMTGGSYVMTQGTTTSTIGPVSRPTEFTGLAVGGSNAANFTVTLTYTGGTGTTLTYNAATGLGEPQP